MEVPGSRYSRRAAQTFSTLEEGALHGRLAGEERNQHGDLSELPAAVAAAATRVSPPA